MKIEILAVGRLRKGESHLLAQDYLKRISSKITITEIEAHSTKEEQQKLLSLIRSDAYVMALDEKGRSLPSREFASKIQKLQNNAQPLLQFIIGGADGLNDDIRKRANLLLSFGAQTWPHMLARVMLLEQIYRAQQILSNHPYHRD